MLCPVVGLGWGGVCYKYCYVRSCLWGWGGLGFTTQTVLRPVCGFGAKGEIELITERQLNSGNINKLIACFKIHRL